MLKCFLKKYPPTEDAVRATCHLNSTLIKPTSENSCILISAAQADPGGIFAYKMCHQIFDFFSILYVSKFK